MGIPNELPSYAVLALAELQSAQLLMLAGFVMLGWVLARRQLRMRKRVNRDAKAANQALKRIRESSEPSVPLADAPAETQRWHVALFDLQRELKAELDTRIHVVHSLMRQLDDRIERLTQLERRAAEHSTAPASRTDNPRAISATETLRAAVIPLVQAGQTASEIAQQTGLPLGEVEILMSTIHVD